MGFLEHLLVLGRVAGQAGFYSYIGTAGLNQCIQAVGIFLAVNFGICAWQQQDQKRQQID